MQEQDIAKDNADLKDEIARLHKPSMSNGLAAIGSGIGLIYGIANQKRWWFVILLMVAGGGIGRGAGYVIESNKKCK